LSRDGGLGKLGSDIRGIMMMELFWGSTNIGESFQVFGNQHLIALFLISLGLGWMYRDREWIGRHEQKVARILALTLVLQQGLLYAWYLTSSAFSWGETLPLYPCRLSILLSIWMLWKDDEGVYQLVFYWAAAGAGVALLSPDTSTFSFPHFMFLQYFVGHGGLLMAIGFMAWIRNHKISKEAIWMTYRWSLVYAAIVLPVNWITKGNYGYLSRPVAGTLLEMFPKSPSLYLLYLMGSMFLLFGIIHLTIIRKQERETAIRRKA